jgi:hypothetical protein
MPEAGLFDLPWAGARDDRMMCLPKRPAVRGSSTLGYRDRSAPAPLAKGRADITPRAPLESTPQACEKAVLRAETFV